MYALDDCYEVLGLERDATPEEVRRAYRDLAKVWHPDRFPADPALRLKAEEQLRIINAAYQAIRDAQASSMPMAPEEPGLRGWGGDGGDDRHGPGEPGANESPWPRAASSESVHPGAPRRAPRGTVAPRSRTWDRAWSFRARTWLPIAAILIGLRLWSLNVDPRADYDPLADSGFTQAAPESSSGITLDMGRAQNGNWQVTLGVPGQQKGHPYKLEIPGSLRFEVATPGPTSPGLTMSSPRASPPRSNPALPEPAPLYFGIGSTAADVMRVQGTPSIVVGHVWAYGRSAVRFENGRVAGYVNGAGNLRLPPGADRTPAPVSRFSMGSGEDEVLAVQGVPDRMDGSTWAYGPSWVQFRNGRVVGYSNVSGNLQVR